jgi:hypothetical protein
VVSSDLLQLLFITYRRTQSDITQRFYLLVDKLHNVLRNGVENGRNVIPMSHQLSAPMGLEFSLDSLRRKLEEPILDPRIGVILCARKRNVSRDIAKVVLVEFPSKQRLDAILPVEQGGFFGLVWQHVVVFSAHFVSEELLESIVQ